MPLFELKNLYDHPLFCLFLGSLQGSPKRVKKFEFFALKFEKSCEEPRKHGHILDTFGGGGGENCPNFTTFYVKTALKTTKNGAKSEKLAKYIHFAQNT